MHYFLQGSMYIVIIFRWRTVLHISFSDLVHVRLVLDNVSIQLGASSCIAASYAIHEMGCTSATLLYMLSSQSTESAWDVGDLQVFRNVCYRRLLRFLYNLTLFCSWLQMHFLIICSKNVHYTDSHLLTAQKTFIKFSVDSDPCQKY